MQIYDLHPLVLYVVFNIAWGLVILFILVFTLNHSCYTNGLSLISFGLRGYCFWCFSYFS